MFHCQARPRGQSKAHLRHSSATILGGDDSRIRATIKVVIRLVIT